MRVLKWLFHPVYLLVIVVAVAVYINRDVLLAELSQSEEVATLSAKMDSVIASLQKDSERNEKQEVNKPEDSRQQAGSLRDDSFPVHEDVPAAIDAVRQDSSAGGVVDVEKEAVVASPGAHLQAEAFSADSSVDKGMYTDEGSAAEIQGESPEPEASASADIRASIVPKVTAEQILRTWQQARIAAWQGDFASAIEYYQTVMTLQPDNFDAYGEMGNVMLRSGDREGAAEAYYQAAQLINKTPQRVVAWNLLNVIAGIAPHKAEMLYQELTQP